MPDPHSQIHPVVLIGALADRPPPLSMQKEGVIYFSTDTFQTFLSVFNGFVMIWQLQSVTPFGAQFSHLLYVDAGTATPLALQNGSAISPFATIMQAVLHLSDQTCILVTPGTYPENVDWGALGDFNDTALIGITATSCVIAPPTGDVFSWIPRAGSVTTRFNLEQLTLRATAGNRCINLDGNLTPDFMTGIGRVQRVLIEHPGGSDAVFCRRINQLNLVETVNLSAGSTRFNNVSNGIIQGALNTSDSFTVRYDDSDPNPTAGRAPIVFLQDSVVLNLILEVAPVILINAGALVLNMITGSLAITAGGIGPIISCVGTIGLFGLFGTGGITLAYPEPTGGGQVLLDISNADIAGNVLITTAGPTRLPVTARGTHWRTQQAGTIVLGDFIDMDTRDSSYARQDSFVVSGGADTATLDRDRWGIFGVAVPALTVVPISPPYPAGTVNYTAAVNTTNPVAVAVPPGLKTSVSFTASPTADAGSTDFCCYARRFRDAVKQ